MEIIMLVIKVELWPFGDESKKREIAAAEIWNTGTGTIDKGNYDSSFFSDRHGEFYAQLNDHDRTENVWKLISKLIEKGLSE